MMKIVIIGGVAGGMSAATRLRRLNEDAEEFIKRKRIPEIKKEILNYLSEEGKESIDGMGKAS